jgi:hypothetical protein
VGDNGGNAEDDRRWWQMFLSWLARTIVAIVIDHLWNRYGGGFWPWRW